MPATRRKPGRPRGSTTKRKPAKRSAGSKTSRRKPANNVIIYQQGDGLFDDVAGFFKKNKPFGKIDSFLNANQGVNDFVTSNPVGSIARSGVRGLAKLGLGQQGGAFMQPVPRTRRVIRV